MRRPQLGPAPAHRHLRHRRGRRSGGPPDRPLHVAGRALRDAPRRRRLPGACRQPARPPAAAPGLAARPRGALGVPGRARGRRRPPALQWARVSRSTDGAASSPPRPGCAWTWCTGSTATPSVASRPAPPPTASPSAPGCCCGVPRACRARCPRSPRRAVRWTTPPGLRGTGPPEGPCNNTRVEESGQLELKCHHRPHVTCVAERAGDSTRRRAGPGAHRPARARPRRCPAGRAAPRPHRLGGRVPDGRRPGRRRPGARPRRHGGGAVPRRLTPAVPLADLPLVTVTRSGPGSLGRSTSESSTCRYGEPTCRPGSSRSWWPSRWKAGPDRSPCRRRGPTGTQPRPGHRPHRCRARPGRARRHRRRCRRGAPAGPGRPDRWVERSPRRHPHRRAGHRGRRPAALAGLRRRRRDRRSATGSCCAAPVPHR